ISDDAKCIALRLADHDPTVPLHLDNILEICDFSYDTFCCACHRHQLTGNVAKAKAIGRGQPCIYTETDAVYLCSLTHRSSARFLDEYQKLLRNQQYLDVSISTIH
ncbi:hypothetical protein BT96DRAFT_823534, partial [Gymnopus androsaceus JB14]